MFFAEEEVVVAIDFNEAPGLVDGGGFAGVFGEYFDDSALNGIESDVEDLGENANVEVTSF